MVAKGLTIMKEKEVMKRTCYMVVALLIKRKTTSGSKLEVIIKKECVL